MNQPGARVTANSHLKHWILMSFLLFVIPAGAFAGTELTGVIGGLIGGDLNSIIDSGGVSISRSLSNAPLYGVRIGYNIPFIQLEGSFVGSPHGLSLDVQDLPVSIDAKVYYLEANVLVSLLPGFISPFVTAGLGLHYFDFNLAVADFGAADLSFSKLGYNFGGGVKIHLSQLVLRGEIRDHVTPISPEDFGAGDIADELGINADQKLHNVEISFGVGIRF